jgi:hypothetical protein
MADKTIFVTWFLIIIGWVVVYLVAKKISKDNHVRDNLKNWKDKTISSIQDLVEDNVTYLSMGGKPELALLINYKLSTLGSELETASYSQTITVQIGRKYIELKQLISLNDEFMASEITPIKENDPKLQNIIIVADDLIDLLRNLE